MGGHLGLALAGNDCRVQVAKLWIAVHSPQGVDDDLTGAEHTVGQEECVEEVDAEEPQVRQPVKEPVNRRVPYLIQTKVRGDLAGSPELIMLIEKDLT